MSGIRLIGIVSVGVLVSALGLSTLLAQVQRPERSGQSPVQGKEVTLTGKVVDLHCFMTGSLPAKEAVKCTRNCLRSGVPAALETDSGPVLLSKGMKGVGHEIFRYALEMVEIKGKLYEKYGLKYVDVTSIKETTTPATEEEEEVREQPEVEPEPEPEPNQP